MAATGFTIKQLKRGFMTRNQLVGYVNKRINDRLATQLIRRKYHEKT